LISGFVEETEHPAVPVAEFAHYVNEMKARENYAFQGEYDVSLCITCSANFIISLYNLYTIEILLSSVVYLHLAIAILQRLLFLKELPANRNTSWDAAKRSFNKQKNRYGNIVTCMSMLLEIMYWIFSIPSYYIY
jgi:hypothetical protein